MTEMMMPSKDLTPKYRNKKLFRRKVFIRECSWMRGGFTGGIENS